MRDFKQPWRVLGNGTTIVDKEDVPVAEATPGVAHLVAAAPYLAELLSKGLNNGMQRGDMAHAMALLDIIKRS